MARGEFIARMDADDVSMQRRFIAQLSYLEKHPESVLVGCDYEIIDDKEPFYGEVKDLKGVWATGNTLEECRKNLRDVIEGWILVSAIRTKTFIFFAVEIN